jgi:outer membrane immunogenic protein
MHKEDFMGGKFFCSIGLLASVAAGAGSAVAADMPVRPAPPVAASPAVAPDWIGFYVGIHGGGGWGHASFESTTFDNTGSPIFVPPNASPKGGVFGFQVGHNWQWGSVVGGLEIDYSGADIKETSTFFAPTVEPGSTFTAEVKLDALASARGRLGWLLFPNLLAYGTAGIGWGHSRLTTTDTSSIGESFPETNFVNEFGWVAGAGLEWKCFDHWLLRGEWLHYDFGKASHFGLNFESDLDNANVRTTVDVARAALSYKF